MKPVYCLLILLFSILLSSCGAIISEPVSDQKILKHLVPHYKAGQSLSIHNYYKKPTLVENSVQGAMYIQVDLKQLSGASIKLVKQAMAYQNVSVVPSNKKTITIRAHNVYLKSLFNLHLELSAELSNGKQGNVQQTYGKKAYHYERHNLAILPATEKLLKHPDFIKFMNE
ncbi:hypothetical protein MNBD_GAMMA23-2363 [hydrothermal vent metagenome]|uniref:Lipoprotein n=1 Tax=hydrothermal vent metagenome TaxID=652676 RepID=A0A3B1AGM6_9ZZZZ